MLNLEFESWKLKDTLINKGYDEAVIRSVLDGFNNDCELAIEEISQKILEEMRQLALNNDLKDFANALTIIRNNDSISIEAPGMTAQNYIPSMAMLPFLLKNAKTSKKDGSLYKRIPMKKSSKKDIFSLQNDQSKDTIFRTASSKQNAATSWVIPGKEINLLEEMLSFNNLLNKEIDEVIRNILWKYEGGI